MRRRWTNLSAGLLLAGLAGLSTDVSAAASAADELVRYTVSEVLSVLRSDNEIRQGNEARLNALVEEKLLPHFDFTRMTRLAAGRNWSNLSESQRASLVNEFRALLVRTYSVALTRYRDQEIEYMPAPPQHEPTSAVVRTRIKQHGARAVSMDYRLNLQDSEWKVYDILVDGISLVINYRSLFNSTIEASGADGLIEMLRNKNAARETRDAPA